MLPGLPRCGSAAPSPVPLSQVVEYGLFVKHCKVEVYLLELKLCENSDPTNMLSCHFSKADTIGEQLGRALGPIGESAEHCGWWEGGWVPS